MITGDKTEFLLIVTRQQLRLRLIPRAVLLLVNITLIQVCVLEISACSLIVVTKLCNSAFYHFHNIRCIRKYLSRDFLLTLIHAFMLHVPLDSIIESVIAVGGVLLWMSSVCWDTQ